jgi:hypothetical protein
MGWNWRMCIFRNWIDWDCSFDISSNVGWMIFFFVETTWIIRFEIGTRLLPNKLDWLRPFFLCQFPCWMTAVFPCGHHLNHLIWNTIKTTANSQRYCSVNVKRRLFFWLWITSICSIWITVGWSSVREFPLLQTSWIENILPGSNFSSHNCYNTSNTSRDSPITSGILNSLVVKSLLNAYCYRWQFFDTLSSN